MTSFPPFTDPVYPDDSNPASFWSHFSLHSGIFLTFNGYQSLDSQEFYAETPTDMGFRYIPPPVQTTNAGIQTFQLTWQTGIQIAPDGWRTIFRASGARNDPNLGSPYEVPVGWRTMETIPYPVNPDHIFTMQPHSYGAGETHPILYDEPDRLFIGPMIGMYVNGKLQPALLTLELGRNYWENAAETWASFAPVSLTINDRNGLGQNLSKTKQVGRGLTIARDSVVRIRKHESQGGMSAAAVVGFTAEHEDGGDPVQVMTTTFVRRQLDYPITNPVDMPNNTVITIDDITDEWMRNPIVEGLQASYNLCGGFFGGDTWSGLEELNVRVVPQFTNSNYAGLSMHFNADTQTIWLDASRIRSESAVHHEVAHGMAHLMQWHLQWRTYAGSSDLRAPRWVEEGTAKYLAYRAFGLVAVRKDGSDYHLPNNAAALFAHLGDTVMQNVSTSLRTHGYYSGVWKHMAGQSIDGLWAEFAN